MRPGVVLVVEDDASLRAISASVIRDAGFDVAEVENADAALLLVQESPGRISLIFTDVHMPGERDGLDLARCVNARWPGIAIIVTSGRSARPAVLPPSVHFIKKPWLPEDLLAMIDAEGPVRREKGAYPSNAVSP